MNLSKSELITKAQEIIKKDLGTAVPDFYRSEVYQKDKEIVVLFFTPVHVALNGDFYYYGATVELLSESKSYVGENNSTSANSIDPWQFYEPSPKKNQLVKEVIDQLNLYEENGASKVFAETYQMKILEKGNQLMVKVITPHYTDNYLLEKNTNLVISKTSRNHKRPTLGEQGYIKMQ